MDNKKNKTKKQYKVRTTFKLAECVSTLSIDRDRACKKENFLFACNVFESLKGVVRHELSYRK